ncbi:MAG: hypothetical protein HUJ73_06755 [Eubacterium sp.]|nr:hypothetical protein [Eubacterium sp.]
MRVKLPGKKEKPLPVSDPVQHAEKLHGCSFHVLQTVSSWEKDIRKLPERGSETARWYSTGDFNRLGKGYARHCGPTAITNLILLLNSRYGFLTGGQDADTVFYAAAALGKRKMIYWNTDRIPFFGGTNNFLTGMYIRDSLRYFNVPCTWNPSGAGDDREEKDHADVPAPKRLVVQAALPSKAALLQALREGKLIFLELMYHPLYGCHDVLCYGYTTLRCAEDGRRETYLILADGWSREPRYLRVGDPGMFCCFMIR